MRHSQAAFLHLSSDHLQSGDTKTCVFLICGNEYVQIEASIFSSTLGRLADQHYGNVAFLHALLSYALGHNELHGNISCKQRYSLVMPCDRSLPRVVLKITAFEGAEMFQLALKSQLVPCSVYQISSMDIQDWHGCGVGMDTVALLIRFKFTPT